MQKGKMVKRETILGYLFLMPSLIGVSIFIFIPFLDAVRRSFCEAMSGKFVGMDNYETVFSNNAFKLASLNNIKFIFTCIPLLLIISLILSFLIVNLKRCKEIIKTTYLVPMAIPVASVVLIWKIFFHINGLLNKFIVYFNISPIDYLNTNYSFYILIFTYIWKNCGYDIVLWIAGLSTISNSLYEAASIDGCSKFQQFIYITIPNLRTTLFAVTTLSLINSFKVFREAYLISGDYPYDTIYMLQHLFNNWFVTLDVQKNVCSSSCDSIIYFYKYIITSVYM